MDKFDIWCNQKKEIDKKDTIIGLKERSVVFVNMGKNIGYEQNEKGELFLRPVIVLKVFNRNLFLGVALTSKDKKGSFFYKTFYKHKNKIYQSTVILSQIKAFTKGMVAKNKFEIIKEKIVELTLKREPQRELYGKVIS